MNLPEHIPDPVYRYCVCSPGSDSRAWNYRTLQDAQTIARRLALEVFRAHRWDKGWASVQTVISPDRRTWTVSAVDKAGAERVLARFAIFHRDK
jgi:hypothetical protein